MRDALRNARTVAILGGTVAVIGGIYATLMSFITLFFGSLGVFGGGWTGAGFSPVATLLFGFLMIVFGALAINARGPIPGIIVVICSVLGAIFGGLLIAVFMILPLIGGGLAATAAGREESELTTSTTPLRRNAR